MKEAGPFPVPGPEYNRREEADFRRRIEQEIADVYSEIERAKRMHNDREASAALKKYLFLKMGVDEGV